MSKQSNNLADINLKIHESLIEDCRKGNGRAQSKLYQQYARAMFNLACRIMNSREDAEDILQETFVDCFRNIGSFRFESTFGAWLKRILVNKCINELKKKKSDLTFCETLPVSPRVFSWALLHTRLVALENLSKILLSPFQFLRLRK